MGELVHANGDVVSDIIGSARLTTRSEGVKARKIRGEVPIHELTTLVVAQTIRNRIGLGVEFDEERIARELGHNGLRVHAMIIAQIATSLNPLVEGEGKGIRLKREPSRENGYSPLFVFEDLEKLSLSVEIYRSKSRGPRDRG